MRLPGALLTSALLLAGPRLGAADAEPAAPGAAATRSASPAADPLSPEAIAARRALLGEEIARLREARDRPGVDPMPAAALGARLERLAEIDELLGQQSRRAALPTQAAGAAAEPAPPPASARALLERLDVVAGADPRRAALSRALDESRQALEAALRQHRESEQERRRLAEERAAQPADPAALESQLARQELQSRLAGERVNLRRLEVRSAERALAELAGEVERARRDAAAIREQIRSRPDVSSLDLAPLEARERTLHKQREQAARDLETAELRAARARERFTREADLPPEALEEVAARALQRDAAQQALELASDGLERLAAQRQLWTRWDASLRGQASRPELRAWLEDLDPLPEALEGQLRLSRERAADLEERRLGVRERLEDLPGPSPLRPALRAQLAALDALFEAHERDGARVAAELRLARQVQRDLRATLGRPSPGELLGQAWRAAQGTWRYEITEVDDQPISVGKLVMALLLFAIGLGLSRALSRAAGHVVERRLRTRDGAAAAVQTLSFYILVVLFTLLALRSVRFPLTTFTVIGGALAIGVGFGSQNLMNGFISGLILMLERPIRPGDLIEVEGTHGRVERIGARSTKIRAVNGRHIVVPNSFFLEHSLVNWTLSDDLIRTQIDVGVIYGSPTRTVEALIRQALEEQPRVLSAPAPVILFASFGDNALCFEAHFWTQARAPMDLLHLQSAVRFRIDDLFREAGLVIAFPQRDVHLDSTRPIEVRMVDPDPSPARD